MERSSAVRYTYQDLLALPESATRHEILDGKLHVTAAPRVNHQRVALDLAAIMRTLAREHGLGEVVGPVTVHVHDEMVFEPDLVFIRSDRSQIIDPDGDVHGAPDLVVRSVELRRSGSERSERLEETLFWQVGERSFELPLAEIFRAV
jgi:Uma2 family endonuclease